MDLHCCRLLAACNLQLPQPACHAQHMLPSFTLTVGSQVLLVPQRPKTSITANQHGIPLTVGENQLLDPLRWFSMLMQSSMAAGAPISQALVRPLERQGNGS